ARPFSVIPPGDFPIPFETRLRSALRSSTWRMSRRRSASRSTISLTRWAPPLSASARSTASGCSRINLRSSTDETLDGFGGGDGLGFDPRDRAHAVVGVEIDDPHAHRVAALRGHFVGVDGDHLALGGDDEEVVAAPYLDHADHGAVAPGGLDVDDALAGPAPPGCRGPPPRRGPSVGLLPRRSGWPCRAWWRSWPRGCRRGGAASSGERDSRARWPGPPRR